MKHIILFIIIPFLGFSQYDIRDSTTIDLLVFNEIDTGNIGGVKFKVNWSYKNGADLVFTERDTITESYFPTYVDSLIALFQSDSIVSYNTAIGYFNEYRKFTTRWLNAKNRLIKLYAVKPEETP